MVITLKRVFFLSQFIFLIAPVSEGKELHLIAPNIPPHFDEQGRGRIGDVITAVLTRGGYTVKFTTVPFGRHWYDYNTDTRYDGLATAEADQKFPGYTTKPFIHLQDGATVLAGRGLDEIMTIKELAGRHIVAFPNAAKILDIEELLQTFKSFRELAERPSQIRLLLSGRTDAILADGLITAHFIKDLRQRTIASKEPLVDATQNVLFRRIFNKGPQRLYFRDHAITESFNGCYEEMNMAGEIDLLTLPYVEKYYDIVKDQYPIK